MEVHITRGGDNTQSVGHSASSPAIDTLPDDILCSIFHLILQTHGPFSLFDKNNAPVIFTHVCRRWRALAFDTPLLWTNVCLENLHPSYAAERPASNALRKAEMVAKREAIRTWLARSKDCPLAVFLHASPPKESTSTIRGETQFQQDTVDLLHSSVARWKMVQIRLDDSSSIAHYSPLLSHAPDDYQLLEALAINLKSQDDSSNGFPLRIADLSILGAPSLRRITIETPWDNVLASPIAWSTLTHLSIGSYARGRAIQRLTRRHALEILSRCQNLVSCSFYMEDSIARQPTSVLPPPPSNVTLPDLITMTVEGTLNPTTTFASWLTLPSLRHLAIKPSLHIPASIGMDAVLLDWLNPYGKQLESFSFTCNGQLSKRATKELVFPRLSHSARVELSGLWLVSPMSWTNFADVSTHFRPIVDRDLTSKPDDEQNRVPGHSLQSSFTRPLPPTKSHSRASNHNLHG